jgi:hypothetical protein
MAKRTAGLHRRGETYYCFMPDESGKRHERSLHTKNIDDAEVKHEQLKLEVRSGHIPNDLTAGTLGQAIKYWIDHRRYRVAKGTLNSERSIVNIFWRCGEMG